MKLKPFPHQQTELDDHKDHEARGLWWEMGTGKSKAVLDCCEHLYSLGKLDGIFIVAPSGIELNWLTDEIPEHLDIGNVVTFLWATKTCKTQKYARSWQGFMDSKGFRVFAISYDAMMTDRGQKAAKEFLESGSMMYVLDEAAHIKTPGAKRTKRVLASAKHAPYRRVLSGTPVDNSPFDVYTQVKFIDPAVWTGMGIRNFFAFKAQFGVFELSYAAGGKTFKKLTQYRNLDVLKKVMDTVGTRYRKDLLDLPEKIYKRHLFRLSPKAQRIYDALKEDYVTWFGDGKVVSAELAIVRMTRLQQVTSGYLPDDNDLDDEKELHPLDEVNTRVQALREITQDVPGQAIIWAQRNQDIDLILEALSVDKLGAVRYDGKVSVEERAHNVDLFKRNKVQFFVGKPRVGGEGLTLTGANVVIYYNNGWRLRERLQSEARAHRIGQKNAVTYYDIIAENTLDDYQLSVLRNKLDISSFVMGDQLPDITF